MAVSMERFGRQACTFQKASLQRTFPCVQPKKKVDVARLRTILKAESAVSPHVAFRSTKYCGRHEAPMPRQVR
jgi:hypothetical protein